MTFEVEKIEFETCSFWEKVSRSKLVEKFKKEAKGYIPTIETIMEVEFNGGKVYFKFKRYISFNTVCNILSKMNRKYEVIQIEEIEYKPKEKTAEVEVK